MSRPVPGFSNNRFEDVLPKLKFVLFSMITRAHSPLVECVPDRYRERSELSIVELGQNPSVYNELISS